MLHLGRAYLLGAHGELRCVRLADGAVVWKRHLAKEFKAALLAKKREMQDALAEFRRSRATAAATATSPAGTGAAAHRIGKVTDAFDRVYERQTGLSGTARQNSLQQAAQLKELDDLVRDNKIAERMAQLKAAKP